MKIGPKRPGARKQRPCLSCAESHTYAQGQEQGYLRRLETNAADHKYVLQLHLNSKQNTTNLAHHIPSHSNPDDTTRVKHLTLLLRAL